MDVLLSSAQTQVERQSVRNGKLARDGPYGGRDVTTTADAAAATTTRARFD